MSPRLARGPPFEDAMIKSRRDFLGVSPRAQGYGMGLAKA
jgi:hypothetical protein